DYLHAIARLLDRDDFSAKGNLVAELPLKTFRKLVHAANRLEHRHHSRAFGDRSDAAEKAGLQKSGEIMRVAGSARRVLLVGVVLAVQIPFADEERDESLLVVFRQRMIELILIDRFRHQLAGVADHVGLYLAQPNPLPGQWSDLVTFGINVRRVVLVDE